LVTGTGVATLGCTEGELNVHPPLRWMLMAGRRIMAAADAVRCDARDQAEDAFHAMGLIVELLAVLKPREVKQLTDELPEKYHPLVAQSVQALWEVAVWLDEQRNPNRQTPLSE